jgi:hypothetical protein
MMIKQREATTTTLQPSMHTRLHGVLHFAAPSYLGSQEEISFYKRKQDYVPPARSSLF